MTKPRKPGALERAILCVAADAKRPQVSNTAGWHREILRLLRAAKRDRDRLDWLLDDGRIVWPLGSTGPESRVRIDAAMRQGKKA